MEQRVTIIGLGVKDLKASTEFYSQAFGWEKTEASSDTITFIQLNGILLSLYPKDKLAEDAGVSPDGTGFKGFSLAHNGRTKDEVDQIVEEVVKQGATLIKKPEEVFWGGYSGYIADPDGHLWEIAYNPYLPIDEQGNV